MAKTEQPTPIQDLGKISANVVYEASEKYNFAEIAKVFKEDAKKRTDLDKKLVDHIQTLSINKNYELVYYPVYFYKTDTTLYWKNNHTEIEDVFVHGEKVSKLTTTTTSNMSESGIKGKSDLMLKKLNSDLKVDEINLSKTFAVSNFKSMKIPVYEENLFFSEQENSKQGIKTGRKASSAGFTDSTYTVWSAHVILVPIYRFKFEFEGTTCLFEMNLHNGEYCTSYKQKSEIELFKKLTYFLYKTFFILSMLLPVYRFVKGLINGFEGDFILGVIGVIVAEFVAMILYGMLGAKSKFAYEKLVINSRLKTMLFVIAGVISLLVVGSVMNFFI